MRLFINTLHPGSLTRDIYVSTTGSDSNNGSINSPYKTISKAKESVSTYVQLGVTGVINVNIEDGVYRESNTLSFDSSDTNDGLVVNYISTGAAIMNGSIEPTNVTDNAGVWEFTIDPSYTDTIYDLYVNDNRIERCRFPLTGYNTTVNVSQVVLDPDPDPEKPPRVAWARQTVEVDSDIVTRLATLTPEQLNNVRFVIIHNWMQSVRYIESIDVPNNTFSAVGRGILSYSNWDDKQCYFENLPEQIVYEGQWFRDGETFKYHPKSGETIQDSIVEVPVIEELLKFNYCENTNFKKLGFDKTNLTFRNGISYDGMQGAIYLKFAISVNNSTGIHFDDIDVSNTGSHGLDLGRYSTYCSVKNSRFKGIGAGAIRLGPVYGPDEYGNIPSGSHCVANNNNVYDVGITMHEGEGILIGDTNNCDVLNNEIDIVRYSGINMGWTWNYNINQCHDNNVSFNIVSNCGYGGLMDDLGGIYTLGISPNSKMHNNIVFNVDGHNHLAMGFYFDQGSSFIDVRDNLVYDIKGAAFHTNYGQDQVIKNNVAAGTVNRSLQFLRIEPHNIATFENNVCQTTAFSLEVMQSPYADYIYTGNYNSWYDQDYPDLYFEYQTLDVWRSVMGQEINSIASMGGTLDRVNKNFTVDPTVAAQIGFVQPDFSLAGNY